MTFGFVFPGQGSQSVGMLAALVPAAGSGSVIRDTFAEASAMLGYDLAQLVAQGPAERLNRTECTQPAMLAVSIATWRLWREVGGPEPQVVCGHSLGEFSALVAAGALDYAAAIDLVRFRGQVMQEAVPEGTGAMAAILGLDDAQVIEACREAAQGGIVEAVNFNAPGQVVIAGAREPVERAIEAAKGRGAKRAVALPVSVPAHSSLMRSAAQRLAERLATVAVRTPRIRFVSAVDASAHEDPTDLRELLIRQLSSPVRWSDTVRALAASGVRSLIECGPGKVLTALNRRIDRALESLALEDAASLEAALARAQAQ
ncbi:MAG TPA: ACP S-malonyltransferase [Steroidobacteraceae bacterium]|nr:ACP S-malonyltransferase [Steroidobacteraceae bacterium]